MLISASKHRDSYLNRSNTRFLFVFWAIKHIIRAISCETRAKEVLHADMESGSRLGVGLASIAKLMAEAAVLNTILTTQIPA